MTRTRTIALALLAVAALAVGGYIAYDQVLRGDSVAALALPTETSTPPAASAPAASQDAASRRASQRTDDAASPASGRSAPTASPAIACGNSSPTCRPNPTRSAARPT